MLYILICLIVGIWISYHKFNDSIEKGKRSIVRGAVPFTKEQEAEKKRGINNEF